MSCNDESLLFLTITCDRPTLQYPLHISANSNRSSYNYNNSIEFTCSLGYTIQNSSVKYCTHTDAFQRNLPSCKGMQIHAKHSGIMQVTAKLSASRPKVPIIIHVKPAD